MTSRLPGCQAMGMPGLGRRLIDGVIITPLFGISRMFYCIRLGYELKRVDWF